MSGKIRKILVASRNPGKVGELRAMLGGGIGWVGLSDFPDIGEIEEDGETFAANARKKATGYAKASGLWTIADDSGLVVDALVGQPGVRSARFSGAKDADRALIDHKNIAKVLELLKKVPRERRTARFVCCLCLANQEEVLAEVEGRLEGFIGEEEGGENGFGYDPIFFLPELDKTVAQLTREEKNTISHRGNAIRKLKPLLDELLRGG
jgi:XTP/dITP diphosphohydrolase